MVSKLKDKYQSSSITVKISSVFVVLFFFIILVESIIFGIIMHKFYLEEIHENIDRNLSTSSLMLNNLTQNLEQASNELMLNVNNNIRENPDIYNITDINKIIGILRQSKTLYNSFSSITYVLKNGNYFSTNNTIDISLAGNISDSDLFDEIKKQKEDTKYSFLYGKNLISSATTNGQLYYIKAVRSIKDLTIKGWILIELNPQILTENLSVKDLSINLYFDENIILSTNKSLNIDIIEFANSKSKTINDKEIYILNNHNDDYFYNGFKVNNFTIYILSSIKVYEETFRKIILIVIFICLIIGFVLLQVIKKLSSSISNPFMQFTKHMEFNKVNGLTKYYNTKGNGKEVKVLINRFNNLVDSNIKLIEENAKKEKETREYELALYQAQIKPHFLYNTLDVIIRLIALDRKQEAITITTDIAKFYRLALSNGDEIISIEKEVELTSKYLIIQQTRYPDVLFYEIDVPDKIKKYYIPKFTLQPLVENAIYHGIKPKRERGFIKISGYENGDFVFLSVIDNGVGISNEVINMVNKGIVIEKFSKPYGLVNVKERLTLYYGNLAVMKIESKINKGSNITIKIPKG